MITVRRAEKTGSRDDRRRRLILQIGVYRFHITREEARRLRNQLNRFKLERKRA